MKKIPEQWENNYSCPVLYGILIVNSEKYGNEGGKNGESVSMAGPV